jgi:multidrug efflux system membrane fusion protein
MDGLIGQRAEPSDRALRDALDQGLAPGPRLGNRLVPALALAAAVAGLLAWRLPWGGAGDGQAVAPAPVAVLTARAAPGDIPVSLSGLGTVTPLATITVRTQISGLLTQIGFTEGQMVHQGDFLAQIDPRPYQAALDQALGQLAHDQALLAGARKDLARYQQLIRQNSIARQLVDTSTYLVQQDEGTVRVDQALVDTARLNLSYCRIVSPIDGRVGLRLVDAGNFVQTTNAGGIVVVTQMQPMSVIFTLPEDDLPQLHAQLHAQQHAGATLPVAAYDRSDTTRLAVGALQTFDNLIDPATGTVRLRAVFPNTDDALFPSQFVNARLLLKTLRGALVVPGAAVQTGANGSYVYVVRADHTVVLRPVRLGPADGDRVSVLAGLAPGERVVVDGGDRLRDGAAVTLASAPADPAPTPAAAP